MSYYTPSFKTALTKFSAAVYQRWITMRVKALISVNETRPILSNDQVVQIDEGLKLLEGVDRLEELTRDERDQLVRLEALLDKFNA